ncbi:MAG: TIGR02117 family protein [Oleiphilus sp.]|nr:MAG: TIGR02117 family protein [Oleiphilus sp.]
MSAGLDLTVGWLNIGESDSMAAKLILLFLCSVMAACATRPADVLAQDQFVCAEQALHRVYVTNHGWHTGLVLDALTLKEHVDGLQTRFPNVRFIEVGWGDAGFYQAEDITASLVLKAIAWPSRTVLHLVGFNTEPSDYFSQSEVLAVQLTPDQMRALIGFIASTFARDTDLNVHATRPGIYGDSQFYEAVGTYYLFNTCNNWTARALHQAGLKISPALKMTAQSVMSQVREWNHCED